MWKIEKEPDRTVSMSSAARRRLIGICTGLALLGTSGTALAVPVITMSPLPATLSVGDTFDISLTFDSGVATPGTPSLKFFSLGFAWTGGALAATAVTFGTGLNDGDGANSNQFSSITASAVELSEVSLLTDATLDMVQPASFLMATISFEAIAAGIASFRTRAVKFTDNLTGGGKIHTPGPVGSVTVTGVPEPASFLLVLTGLAALASLHRTTQLRRFVRMQMARLLP